jgi:hypothetical protein
VATVDSNTGVVTIVAAGSCTFTATQAATNNYFEGNAKATLVVNGTTSTVFDWNHIIVGQYTFEMSPVTYDINDNLVITYDRLNSSGSDTITGTVASISGNIVTLNVSASSTATPYTPVVQIHTTSPDSSIYGTNVASPIFMFYNDTCTPNPPVLPTNTILTDGEIYVFGNYESQVPTPFSITVEGTADIQRPLSSTQPTQPYIPPPPNIRTPFNWNSTAGCFIPTSQQITLIVNTNIRIDYGLPQGASEEPNPPPFFYFCGFFNGYQVDYSSGIVIKNP